METLAQIAFDSLGDDERWANLHAVDQKELTQFCRAVQRVLVEELAKLAEAQNTYSKQDAVNLAAELVEKMQ